MSKEIWYQVFEPRDQSNRQKQIMVEQVKDKIFWQGEFWAQSEKVKSDGRW